MIQQYYNLNGESESFILTVFDGLVKAVPCFIKRQEVVEVLISAQVCIDPVGESELLLRPDRVGRAWRKIMSRS